MICRVRITGEKSPIPCVLCLDDRGEWLCLKPRDCDDEMVKRMMATWSSELAFRARARKRRAVKGT